MTYYVYQLSTTACSKYYIGITNNPERRLRQHLHVAKHPWKKLTKCGAAVKRYGPETFSMRILEECATEDEAMNLETMWIQRFGPKRTWNSQGGRNHQNKGMKGRKQSKETRKKITGRRKNVVFLYNAKTHERKEFPAGTTKVGWMSGIAYNRMMRNKRET